MKYLDYSAFSKEYPIDDNNIIGSGTYGEIYEVQNKNIVVKKGTFNGMINDVNVMSNIVHPNILSGECYTIIDKNILIAMTKGERIMDYLSKHDYERKHNILKKLLYGILCGINALHRGGILHGDIKPSNIVIIDNIPKLIDFGMSERIADLHTIIDDKPIILKGVTSYHSLNTDTFRAPEDIAGNFITDKSDIFAFGKTVECLYLRIGSYLSNLPLKVHDPLLSDFIALTLHHDYKHRSGAEELLQHEYFNEVRDVIIEPIICADPIPSNDNGIITRNMPPKLYEWLIRVAMKMDVSIRALFLTIHNVRRTMHIANNHNFQLLGLINLNLACYQCGEQSLDIKDSLITMARTYNKDEYIQMRANIIIALEGLVYANTYWDRITCGEDIIPNLLKTMKWDYNGSDKIYESNNSKYSKWQSSIMLVNWHTKNYKRFISMINTDAIDEYDEDLNNPKPISYIPKASALSLQRLISNISWFPSYNLNNVYAIKDNLKNDAVYANTILHTLMNIKSANKDEVLGYDIIFDKKKLTLWNKNIKDLEINTYTSTYEEIISVLE